MLYTVRTEQSFEKVQLLDHFNLTETCLTSSTTHGRRSTPRSYSTTPKGQAAESMPSVLACPNPRRLSQEWLSQLRRDPPGSFPPTPHTSVFTHRHAQMKGSPDRIQSCTSTYFDGVIALVDPETSWVGRWQRTCEPPFGTSLVPWTDILTAKQLETCAACMPCGSRVEFPMMWRQNWRVEVLSTAHGIKQTSTSGSPKSDHRSLDGGSSFR